MVVMVYNIIDNIVELVLIQSNLVLLRYVSMYVCMSHLMFCVHNGRNELVMSVHHINIKLITVGHL